MPLHAKKDELRRRIAESVHESRPIGMAEAALTPELLSKFATLWLSNDYSERVVGARRRAMLQVPRPPTQVTLEKLESAGPFWVPLYEQPAWAREVIARRSSFEGAAFVFSPRGGAQET